MTLLVYVKSCTACVCDDCLSVRLFILFDFGVNVLGKYKQNGYVHIEEKVLTETCLFFNSTQKMYLQPSQ